MTLHARANPRVACKQHRKEVRHIDVLKVILSEAAGSPYQRFPAPAELARYMQGKPCLSKVMALSLYFDFSNFELCLMVFINAQNAFA